MFFYVGKIFWALCNPLTLIGLTLMLGALLLRTRWKLWGRRLFGAGLALFLLLGFLPVGSNLMVWLESRYPVPDPLPIQVDGIIVLGGAVLTGRSESHGQVSLNEYAERITEAVRLHRLYPQARLVFSGGEGSLLPSSTSESKETKKLLNNLGISTDRIVFETQSRSTYENMKDSTSLIHPQPGENWLLVTSAFHLPRSIGVFRKGGWNVIPYPAGFLEEGRYLIFPTLDLLGNFYKLQVAAKEIVGIIAYRLSGKL